MSKAKTPVNRDTIRRVMSKTMKDNNGAVPDYVRRMQRAYDKQRQQEK